MYYITISSEDIYLIWAAISKQSWGQLVQRKRLQDRIHASTFSLGTRQENLWLLQLNYGKWKDKRVQITHLSLLKKKKALSLSEHRGLSSEVSICRKWRKTRYRIPPLYRIWSAHFGDLTLLIWRWYIDFCIILLSKKARGNGTHTNLGQTTHVPQNIQTEPKVLTKTKIG